MLSLALGLILAASSWADGSAPPVPNLTGLPTMPAPGEAPSLAEEIQSNTQGNDADCAAQVPAPLRAAAFQHFRNFQAMENAQGAYLNESALEKAAHLLGMVLKESSGDATDVTGMNGHEFSTYQAQTNLTRWNALFSQKNISLNSQTNYGIAQQSMDRMTVGFTVQTKLGGFLGSFGASSTSSQDVRQIIDIYQGFAQGRLTQDDRTIPFSETRDPSPETNARLAQGARAALWHCGTRFLFQEGQSDDGNRKLEDAVSSIAYCDSGTRNPDPKNVDQVRCFARWATLCPALNLDIALLSPDSYFQTRKTQPRCLPTLQKLAIPPPAVANP